MMKVVYKDHLGDDLTIVNAARVSFDKESKELNDKDKRLIDFLARENHFTPYTHGVVQVVVTAPLFVARQMWKSHVGAEMSDNLTGLGWNEISRRYVDEDPELYMPPAWRKRADNVKQGSSSETFEYEWEGHNLSKAVQTAYDSAYYTYKKLLSEGVCPEQARMVLPQSMMTSWWWTGTLAFYARMCKLRMESHAQMESQELASMIADVVEPLFPVSWSALQKY